MLVTNKQKKTIMRKIHVKKTMMTIASSFVAMLSKSHPNLATPSMVLGQ